MVSLVLTVLLSLLLHALVESYWSAPNSKIAAAKMIYCLGQATVRYAYYLLYHVRYQNEAKESLDLCLP